MLVNGKNVHGESPLVIEAMVTNLNILLVGLSEWKRRKKIDPLKNGHQGGLGGLCGVKGGLQKPNLPISAWDYFLPWDAFFGPK